MIELAITDDGIATISLESPETRNAISPEWGKRFRDVAGSLEHRQDVRVVILQASGTHFCVGGDVGFFAQADDKGQAIGALAGDLHVGLLALSRLPAPLIASVQGPAAGAGLSLVLAADLAIATSSATFVVAYTAIGLSPDGGCSYWLPRRVGGRKATELMLTNRRVGATEAEEIGILTEVVSDEANLRRRVAELAGTLAAGPLAAHAAVRRLLGQTWDSTLAEQLDAEARSIAQLAASPTGAEGIAAFVERRKPHFN